MTHSLKLTAFVLVTSFTGLLHAGEYQNDSGRSAHSASHHSGVTQTAGLFDLFRGYGASPRYRNSYAGYRNSGGYYGNSGYGYGGYRNSGYGGYNTGYRPATRHYRSTGYAPSYGAGYPNAGYGGNYGNGYGSGCSLSQHGGGYYGR